LGQHPAALAQHLLARDGLGSSPPATLVGVRACSGAAFFLFGRGGLLVLVLVFGLFDLFGQGDGLSLVKEGLFDLAGIGGPDLRVVLPSFGRLQLLGPANGPARGFFGRGWALARSGA
jgi:hypothetical protein